MELLCPVLNAWFDCEAAAGPASGTRTVTLADREHCAAAGASWIADADAAGVLQADASLLRSRSESLQDSDCDARRAGERVLGRTRGAPHLWLDAQLVSVARFPHRPGEEGCQCLFSVRWRAGGGFGTRGVEELTVDRLCLRPASEPAGAGASAEGEPAPGLPVPLPAPPAELAAAAPFLRDSRCLSSCLSFFHWCSLREEAQERRRAGGARPWAQHPLLAAHHFCNVGRLEDRGTLAFHCLLRSQRVHSLAGVLWCSLVYRRLNRLSTFADWGGRLPLPQDAPAWLDWLQKRAKEGGGPLFTSKHQQSGGLDGYLDMVRGLAGLVAEGAEPNPLFPPIATLATAMSLCGSAREAHRTLKAAVRHVGDFIAWQVLCDCVEAGVLPRAADDSWVQLGPGAKTGLALIFGEGTGGGVSAGPASASPAAASPGPAAAAEESVDPYGGATWGEVAHLERLRALQMAQPWALAALGRGSHGCVRVEAGEPLLLRELEHSLCEFSKWMALRRGGCSPGGYPIGAEAGEPEPRPLPPPMRIERLGGGRFQVLPPAEEGAAGEAAAAAADGPPVCAAFPDGIVLPPLPEGGSLPPWMPTGEGGSGGVRRPRAAGGGGPRAPKKPKGDKPDKPPRPEKAALDAWWTVWWPAAQTSGWSTVTVVRQNGATAGGTDMYVMSPNNRRFRSRAEVAAAQNALPAKPPAAKEAKEEAKEEEKAAAPAEEVPAAREDEV